MVVALAVTAWFSRRLQHSLTALTRSARAIRDGHYETRVSHPDGAGVSGLTEDFAPLTDTVNEQATRLGDIERTRARLLSDLAHEMRTPLTGIEAHLEAIDDGVRSPDARTLGVIADNTRRLRRLAEDISTVSRAEEGRLELRLASHAVEDLVRAAVTVAAEAYRRRSVALRTGPLASTPVMVDSDRFGQVLANLLQNALNHCRPGDTVTVGAESFPAGKSPASVRIQVVDTGAGVAAKDLPHLFERFYRADLSRTHLDPLGPAGAGIGGSNGSGIGLTISRAIIDAHHGTITAASEGPGQGATLTIDLPTATTRHA